MLRFSANLSLMYPELPLLERFDAARADGFAAVEVQFPYEVPAPVIAERLDRHDLVQALINAFPGDLQAGDLGLAALPGRQRDFADSVDLAIEYAIAMRCTKVHVMAGLCAAGSDLATMRAVYLDNLRMACQRFAEHDLQLLIEPINTRDVPGYFLHSLQEAHAILHEVDAPNLRLMMDFYHLQIMEGDLARKFEMYRHHVGHVQIAGVPGRNEPDSGEINYPYLLALIDRSDYQGWVGCEYRPATKGPGGTSAGLGWLSRYRPAPGN